MVNRLRIASEEAVQMVRMLSIVVLVVAGLVALALQPTIKDNVISVVSVGVTALASANRRQEPSSVSAQTVK